MALAFNLAAVPLKFAIPVLAGLAAGTGAVGAYVATPTATAPITVAALPAASTPTAPVASEQATPAKPDAKPSCEKQTWPYLDNRCLARIDPARKVRLVAAPRDGEAAPTDAPAALVTSDTVLRGPDVAPEVKEQPAPKKPTKRSAKPQQNRDGFKRVYSVYSVPSGESTKPVIVVRPLPLNTYSSRY